MNERFYIRESMKVVFFDAEGTLYRTKEGKEYSDFWEGGEHTLERAVNTFELNDGVAETLSELNDKNIQLAVVSVHKDHILPHLLAHLGISDFFGRIMINGDKGDLMSAFLIDRGISKKEALMVGDTYEIDIKPAKREGIRSLELGREIKTIPELLNHID